MSRDLRQARANGLVTGGGMLLQQGLAFLSGIFVAKVLGPARYGEVSVLRSLFQLILVLSPLGLDLAIYRVLPRYDADPGAQRLHFRRFRLIVAGVGLLTVAVLGLAGGPLLARAGYAWPGFAGHWLWTLAALPLAADLALMICFFRVQGRVVPIMLIANWLAPIARTGANIAAVTLGFGVAGVVLGTSGSYVVGCAGALLYWRWWRLRHPAARADAPWGESWALFLSAPAMALNLFAYTVMRTIDMIVVGAMAPAADVGNYAVVSNVSQLVPVAAVALSQTLGAAIARHHHAGNIQGIRDDLNRFIAATSVLSGFVFGGIAAFGTHLDVIFGTRFHPDATIALLIPLGYLASAALAPTGYALTMCGRERSELAVLTGAAVLLTVSAVILTRLYGATGTAAAVLIGFGVGDIARLMVVRRVLGMTIGRWRDLAPPVLALTLGQAVDRLIVPAHPGFWALFGGCAVYAGVYGAAALGWRRWA